MMSDLFRSFVNSLSLFCRALPFIAVLLCSLFFSNSKAYAQCCVCQVKYPQHSILSKGSVTIAAHLMSETNINTLESAAILGISGMWNALSGSLNFIQNGLESQGLRYLSLMNTFWAGRVESSIRDVASDLSAIATLQSMLTGKFFDAQQMMETVNVIQNIRARAHHDYHPSVTMCEFASNTTSLFESGRYSEIGAYILSQRSLDRVLNSANTFAAQGNDNEENARIELFKTVYCDPNDYDGRLDLMCTHANGIGGNDPLRHNKDIDFFRTIVEPSTLNVNLNNSNPPLHSLTNDEIDLFSLAANLYNYEIFNPISPADLRSGSSDGLSDAFAQIMDRRSHIAKMSVAENSFNQIVSKKFEGSPGSREFSLAVLESMGLSSSQATSMLDGLSGDTLNPSYDMQMEMLTKHLIQSPDFYTNLYGKPADVRRIGVAIQAIVLMQKFDLFESNLRNESNLSVLLEINLSKEQQRIEDLIAGQSSQGMVVTE